MNQSRDRNRATTTQTQTRVHTGARETAKSQNVCSPQSLEKQRPKHKCSSKNQYQTKKKGNYIKKKRPHLVDFEAGLQKKQGEDRTVAFPK